MPQVVCFRCFCSLLTCGSVGAEFRHSGHSSGRWTLVANLCTIFRHVTDFNFGVLDGVGCHTNQQLVAVHCATHVAVFDSICDDGVYLVLEAVSKPRIERAAKHLQHTRCLDVFGFFLGCCEQTLRVDDARVTGVAEQSVHCFDPVSNISDAAFRVFHELY